MTMIKTKEKVIVEKFSMEEVAEMMQMDANTFNGDSIDFEAILRQQYRPCHVCEQWVDLGDLNGEDEICDQCIDEMGLKRNEH